MGSSSIRDDKKKLPMDMLDVYRVGNLGTYTRTGHEQADGYYYFVVR